MDWRGWWRRLFPPRVRVVPEGKGYRVNGEWCDSQVEVRRRLEALGLDEGTIVRLLRDLNQAKYGDPFR